MRIGEAAFLRQDVARELLSRVGVPVLGKLGADLDKLLRVTVCLVYPDRGGLEPLGSRFARRGLLRRRLLQGDLLPGSPDGVSAHVACVT